MGTNFQRGRVFFCYAHEDYETVKVLYDKVKVLGYVPWLDKLDLLPGQKWRIIIPEILRNSHVVLMFFSSNSLGKRGFIQREYKLVREVMNDLPGNDLYIIPIRLDDCEIPEEFNDIQYIDFSEEFAFARIYRSIRETFLAIKAPATTPTP